MSNLNAQQQLAVADISNNVHVAAGAGTGKTSTLTERYFHIVESNLQSPSFGLENILAITFTKAAALEMRTRIRGKLGQEYEKVKNSDKDKSGRLAEFLSQFDRAQIMTIDSLQAKILRDNPVEAGINPDYQVLEEMEYDLGIAKLVTSFLNENIEDPDLNALTVEYKLNTIQRNLIALDSKDKPQLESADIEELLAGQDIAEKTRAEHWLNLYRKLAKYLRQHKDKDDMLGFSDVARRAVALLRDNSDIRHFYQKQYRYIMVDEFQDTNAAQQELIYLLCGDADGSLTGRKLFVVGDEKQSIYRFRGAEVKVFNKVCQEMDAKGGSSYDLVTNYRSTPQVINFVNQIFGEQGLNLENYKALEYPSEKAEQEAALPVLKTYISDENTKLKHDQLLIEAADVAKYIEGLLQQKQILPKDIAILLPVTTNVGYLTEALQAKNIDYVVLGGKGFYETQEVLDILNILKVLHHPDDSIALLGVLRSPYCGVDDQSLTDFCRANGGKELFKALAQVEPNKNPLLHRAGEILSALVTAAQNLPVAELWQRIFADFNVEFTLKYQNQGEQQWANVLKLETLCLNYCITRGCGMVEWLDFLQDTMGSSKETAADLPAASAVQIMSIHKSKGLQFNTVILPFLNRNGKMNDTLQVLFNVEEKEFGSKSSRQEGEGYTRIKENNKAGELAERKRLLYVALTRAEERLYLSGWQKEADMEPGEENFWTMVQFGKDLAENEIGAVTATPTNNANAGVGIDFSVREELNPVVALPHQTFFTPSRLQSYLHCQRQYYYQYGCGLPGYTGEQNIANASTGGNKNMDDLTSAEQGTLIHAALEYYQGVKEFAWKKAVKNCGFENKSADNAKAMYLNYLDSDLFKTIPQEHQREVKFQLPVDDGVVFGGVIDCLYSKTDGTYGVVDYKTGKVPDQMNEGYAMQLAIYAEAVAKMRLGQVSELQLHYLQACAGKSIIDSKDTYTKAKNLAKEIQKKRYEQDFETNCAHCSNCDYAYLCPAAGLRSKDGTGIRSK